jgi:hypothetical protein
VELVFELKAAGFVRDAALPFRELNRSEPCALMANRAP